MAVTIQIEVDKTRFLRHPVLAGVPLIFTVDVVGRLGLLVLAIFNTLEVMVEPADNARIEIIVDRIIAEGQIHAVAPRVQTVRPRA